MKQSDIFLDGEGDAWLARNRNKRYPRDIVVERIEANGIVPKRVLEIGCSDGRRLAALRDKYGCEVYGVEPSREACIEAANNKVPVVQSTACCPAVSSSQFDLVIYGFCLYLTDPEDWLQIAAAGDQMLLPGGHIVVHDFASSYVMYARHYVHCEGVLAYHFDFSKLWLAHPLYTMVSRNIGDEATGLDGMVTILKKCHASFIKVQP